MRWNNKNIIILSTIWAIVATVVRSDIYLHNPSGSNNRNRERNENRNNANRLFDSQNNVRTYVYSLELKTRYRS